MPYKDPEARRKCAREVSHRHRVKKRAEKQAAQEAEWAARPILCEDEYAWAAGMFEGEGTATISGSGTRKNYSRSIVTLTSTDREIVDFFFARWGGCYRTRQPPGRAKLAHVWSLHGFRIIPFLEDLLPHIRTERRRAVMTLVLASQRARRQGSRDVAYLDMMNEFRVQVRALNRRGVSP